MNVLVVKMVVSTFVLTLIEVILVCVMMHGYFLNSNNMNCSGMYTCRSSNKMLYSF